MVSFFSRNDGIDIKEMEEIIKMLEKDIKSKKEKVK
jgi:hypothetical protein